jgi:hypothetical protein
VHGFTKDQVSIDTSKTKDDEVLDGEQYPTRLLFNTVSGSTEVFERDSPTLVSCDLDSGSRAVATNSNTIAFQSLSGDLLVDESFRCGCIGFDRGSNCKVDHLALLPPKWY